MPDLTPALERYLLRAGRELDAALTRELSLAGIIPERSTMPARSEISGLRKQDRVTYGSRDETGPSEGPAISMGETALAMTEQESSDRDRMADVSQWLGLLDVPRDVLRERVAGRPLGATTDDLRQIQVAQRFVSELSSRLFELHEGLRGAISEHVAEHDQRSQGDAEKAAASDARR